MDYVQKNRIGPKEPLLVPDMSAPEYILTGIANTVTGLSVIFPARRFPDMGNIVANAPCFVPYKRWTFKYTRPEFSEDTSFRKGA